MAANHAYDRETEETIVDVAALRRSVLDDDGTAVPVTPIAAMDPGRIEDPTDAEIVQEAMKIGLIR